MESKCIQMEISTLENLVKIGSMAEEHFIGLISANTQAKNINHRSYSIISENGGVDYQMGKESIKKSTVILW